MLIARRELQSYLRTMSGYIIIALMLFIDGAFFNAFAVPGTAKKSSEVLAGFFYITSGITLLCSVFLSMRLIAEERQTGTVSLLYSSPVHDLEIVLGKYLASLVFLTMFLVGTLHMPVLIAVYGKVSASQIAVGYLGLFLVGSMGLAVGTFGSALTKSQVVAAVLSGVMSLALTMAWLLGKVTDRPLTEIVNGLAWWGHFEAFSSGVIHLKHVSYFVLVSFLALFAATRVLEARRWK
ncbi:MAG: hypothetical protein DI536_21720 [Archangium gephyra]|uniref:ABC transporter permease n=1 Tax=Archangium gephyra TaxID=48 RepID=A0A2W5T238_9BACT|nr:MAG: hypothetical protein DI536_21720 [Archangium gephyra]